MEKLLTEIELADFLKVSVLTVRRNRSAAPHRLPSHVKFGSSVRYRLSTVLDWIEEHEVGRGIPNQMSQSIEGETPKKEKRAGPGRPTKAKTVARGHQEAGR